MYRLILLLLMFLSFAMGASLDKEMEKIEKKVGQILQQYRETKKTNYLIDYQNVLKEAFVLLGEYRLKYPFVKEDILINMFIGTIIPEMSVEADEKVLQTLFTSLRESEIDPNIKSGVYESLYHSIDVQKIFENKKIFIENAYEINPQSVDVKYIYAIELMSSDADKAVSLLKEIVSDPYIYGNKELLFSAMLRLAIYYEESEDITTATEYYEKLYQSQLFSSDKIAKTLLKSYLKLGRLNNVFDITQELYEKNDDKNYLTFHYLFGYGLNKLSTDEKKALSEFEKYSDIESSSVRRLLQAVQFEMKGEVEKAYSMVLKEKTNVPILPNLLLYRFSLKEELKEENQGPFETLVFFFETVKQNDMILSLIEERDVLYGSGKDLYLKGRISMNEGRDAEAKQFFLECVGNSKCQMDEVAAKTMVTFFLSKNDDKSGVLVLSRVIKDGSKQPLFHLQLSLLYEREKKYDAQLEILKQLEKIGGMDFEVLYSYVRLYDKLGDVVKMKKYFHELVNRYPMHGDFYNYYAFSLMEKNMDIDDAMSNIEKALKFDDTNIYYLDTYAWGYYLKKNYDEAKKIMDNVLETIKEKEENKNFGELYFHAAKIEYALNNLEVAKKYVERSDELGYKDKSKFHEQFKKESQTVSTEKK